MRVCCVLAIAALGCATASPGAEARAGAEDVGAVSWLTGCWRHTSTRGTVIDEQWRRTAPDTMAGAGVTRRDGRVVESEIMHIVARDGVLTFIAQPSGQSRAEFRAVAVEHGRAVFENARHDFPQRISYRIAGDSLHARIDGIVNGAERAIDFPMARAVCSD